MNTMQPTTTGARASATSGRLERVPERTESADSCPVCGHTDALIPLGVRYDRPHRWRPWIIAPTHLSLCDRCDALAEVRVTPKSVRVDRLQQVPPGPALIGA